MLNNITTNDSKLTTSDGPPDFSGVQALLNDNRAAAESPKERSFMNTVGEVWRGERSLTETWWIWKVLIGNLGIGVGLGFLAGVLSSVTHSSLPIYLLLAICLPYDIWTWVGCIRSAWTRQGFWGWVVIILCILGLVAAFASIPSWVRLLTLYR
jgi:hypothetical protein